MINLLKKIFLKKNKVDSSALNKNTIFKKQVNNALNKCKTEKELEFVNIENVKKWAKDIILEIFDVPSAFWYEELKEYENIKFHEKNLSISKNLVEKTDKLIEEYREQIKLSESKINFCNTLILEYEIILKKHINTANKINSIENEEAKLNLVKKHRKRIAKIRSNTGNFNKIYEDTNLITSLNDEINSLEDEFKVKQEVTEYLENLDKEFIEDADNIDSLPIRKEIDKLIFEIKGK